MFFFHYLLFRGNDAYWLYFIGAPPLVSRRVLETLTYLARNHPYVAKILLQFKFFRPTLQESENANQDCGKAVMAVDHNLQSEGYLSIALLLSLLNQPLYLRSIAHLEQVLRYIELYVLFLLLVIFGMLRRKLIFWSLCFFCQLLNLLEVIIDNAESKSNVSEQSAPSTAEQPAALEVSSSDAEVNAESGGVSSGVGTSSNIGAYSKTTASATDSEFDSHIILANLPEAELRLLCSLLAREGYELALIDRCTFPPNCFFRHDYFLIRRVVVMESFPSLVISFLVCYKYNFIA